MSNNSKITYIDLFAGVGGFHRAFQQAGAECVFANDYDRKCAVVYLNNYKGSAKYFKPGPIEDYTKNNNFMVPEHNILVAGFPCQPFSIAGVSKKNALGRPHGFLDKTQGTLFYEIVKIIEKRNPDAFILENVKNLKYHNGGDTYETIMNALDLLGYNVPEPQIIDAKNFVPQHRERIFIIGFKKKYRYNFEYPEIKQKKYNIIKYLESDIDKKYTLTPNLWKYLQDYKKKHKAAGNGFGYGLVEPGVDNYTRTLSARYYKDGAEALISRGKNARPRRLTPRECANLMGFPKSHNFDGVSDTQAYMQFGNAVVVPLATLLAKEVVNQLKSLKNKSEVKYIRQRIYMMGESSYQDYPWRSTSNRFHALVAEMFLQRTKAKQVIKVYSEFSKKYKNPAHVLNDKSKSYREILKPLGLHWRIQHFEKMCRQLVENYNGTIPDNKTELMTLAGIGDYASSAFLSFHLQKPEPLIDSNTVRFISRFFGIEKNQESRRNKVFKGIIRELLPNRKSNRFNYSFLDFTMLICGPKPACEKCSLKKRCEYFINTIN
jgi:DNA (cytosine-5)-methyltransferase 1